MKRIVTVLIMLCLCIFESGAQIPGFNSPKDGWSITPLPLFGFDTDLGFKFGGFVDFIEYGRTPSRYPDYYQKIHVEATYSTMGQRFVEADYWNDSLIPGTLFTANLSWKADPLCSFFGFNGSAQDYDPSLNLKNGVAYYSFKRDVITAQTDFQRRIGKHLKLITGASFQRYITRNIDFAKYSENTLYKEYCEDGIILEDERYGGNTIEFKCGVSIDTRDWITSPRKGIWAELYFSGSPDFFHTGYPYLKLIARYRQYWSPFSDRLTFAWHLAYQGTIWGRAPYYIQSNIYTLQMQQTYNEGLGGVNTLRGVMNKKLVGDGYVWANIETRIRLIEWSWNGIDFGIGISPFFDCGMIAQPYRVTEMSEATGMTESAVRSLATAVHPSAGAGFNICYNKNTLVTVQLAKAFRKEDGPLSLAFLMNYIF